MRILHLGKYYSPVKGGIESTSKYIVDYLSDYEHCVLCFNDKFESKQDIVDGTSVLRTSTIAVIKSQPISLSYMTLLKKKLMNSTRDNTFSLSKSVGRIIHSNSGT